MIETGNTVKEIERDITEMTDETDQDTIDMNEMIEEEGEEWTGEEDHQEKGGRAVLMCHSLVVLIQMEVFTIRRRRWVIMLIILLKHQRKKHQPGYRQHRKNLNNIDKRTLYWIFQCTIKLRDSSMLVIYHQACKNQNSADI